MLQFTGDDALLVVWDADTGEQIQEISCPFNGPVTSTVWLPMQQGAAQAFAFGCSDGSLQVYAQINQQVSCSFVRDIIVRNTICVSLYTVSHHTQVHTKVLLKTLLLSKLITDSQVSVMVLYRFGTLTVTVSFFPACRSPVTS